MSTEPQRAFSLLDPVLDVMAAIEATNSNDSMSPPAAAQQPQPQPQPQSGGFQEWAVPLHRIQPEQRGPPAAGDLAPLQPPQWGLAAQEHQQQAPPSAAPSLSRVGSGVTTRGRTAAAAAAAQAQPPPPADGAPPPSPGRHGSGSRSVLSQVNAAIDTPPRAGPPREQQQQQQLPKHHALLRDPAGDGPPRVVALEKMVFANQQQQQQQQQADHVPGPDRKVETVTVKEEPSGFGLGRPPLAPSGRRSAASPPAAAAAAAAAAAPWAMGSLGAPSASSVADVPDLLSHDGDDDCAPVPPPPPQHAWAPAQPGTPNPFSSLDGVGLTCSPPGSDADDDDDDDDTTGDDDDDDEERDTAPAMNGYGVGFVPLSDAQRAAAAQQMEARTARLMATTGGGRRGAAAPASAPAAVHLPDSDDVPFAMSVVVASKREPTKRASRATKSSGALPLQPDGTLCEHRWYSVPGRRGKPRRVLLYGGRKYTGKSANRAWAQIKSHQPPQPAAPLAAPASKVMIASSSDATAMGRPGMVAAVSRPRPTPPAQNAARVLSFASTTSDGRSPLTGASRSSDNNVLVPPPPAQRRGAAQAAAATATRTGKQPTITQFANRRAATAFEAAVSSAAAPDEDPNDIGDIPVELAASAPRRPRRSRGDSDAEAKQRRGHRTEDNDEFVGFVGSPRSSDEELTGEFDDFIVDGDGDDDTTGGLRRPGRPPGGSASSSVASFQSDWTSDDGSSSVATADLVGGGAPDDEDDDDDDDDDVLIVSQPRLPPQQPAAADDRDDNDGDTDEESLLVPAVAPPRRQGTGVGGGGGTTAPGAGRAGPARTQLPPRTAAHVWPVADQPPQPQPAPLFGSIAVPGPGAAHHATGFGVVASGVAPGSGLGAPLAPPPDAPPPPQHVGFGIGLGDGGGRYDDDGGGDDAAMLQLAGELGDADEFIGGVGNW